jgi:hypothetical protein
MLVVRVTENVRAVQSSYYSSCPCPAAQRERERAHVLLPRLGKFAFALQFAMFALGVLANIVLTKAVDMARVIGGVS